MKFNTILNLNMLYAYIFLLYLNILEVHFKSITSNIFDNKSMPTNINLILTIKLYLQNFSCYKFCPLIHIFSITYNIM